MNSKVMPEKAVVDFHCTDCGAYFISHNIEREHMQNLDVDTDTNEAYFIYDCPSCGGGSFEFIIDLTCTHSHLGERYMGEEYYCLDCGVDVETEEN